MVASFFLKKKKKIKIIDGSIQIEAAAVHAKTHSSKVSPAH